MRLSDLEREGLPARIIELWRRRQGESLLPVQSRAIRRGLLKLPLSAEGRRGMGMIVSAPTSSGKSFCAELAAVRALTAREKVLMLFPLKSLAEEKYRLLKETFGSLGIEVIILTGDHPENDNAFLGGRYNIAIGIYEKFDLLTAARLDCLANVGLIVVDELQMIAEPGRGAILERLLTRIKGSCYTPGFLGLSAVLGDKGGRRLADWLGAELVEEETRPVELLRGVAAEGEYRFLAYNSGESGCEPFEQPAPGESLIGGLINQIREGEESVIVFLKSRQDTVSLAMRLAASVSWSAAAEAIAKLQHEEPSYLVRTLRQVLGKGVAFHNSDLSPRQRSIVEQAFTDRKIRTLCSTTTLAMGVNLPADTVYLETVKFSSGVYGDRPTLGPISRAEFDNMSGRAGRLGLIAGGSGDAGRTERFVGTDPAVGTGPAGRAIVLADSAFDREVLWESYIAPPKGEELVSAFDSLPLEDWLLSFIVSGLGGSAAALADVLSKSYRWHRSIRSSQWQGDSLSGLDTVGTLGRLVEAGFITHDINEGDVDTAPIAATPLGRSAVLSGLSCQSARYLRGQLDENLPETMFGWISLVLSAPGWSLPGSLLTRYEQRENLPVKMLYQRFDYSVEEVHYLLPEDHRRAPLGYRAAASLKAALLLDDWRKLLPLRQMEERYGVHLGQILALGETAAHLISATASLLEASDRESPVAETLRQLTFCLKYGLPLEFRELHEQFGELLTRSDMLRLSQAGIDCLGSLVDLSDAKRESILGSSDKAKSIKDKCETLKEEVSMGSSAVMPTIMVSGNPELIEIDGSPQGERFLVKINGYPISLTGKSFKYLTKLAWWRLKGEGGWLYKEDIEAGFNQARYLYRMKNEIGAAIAGDWPVFENNRLGYYRLKMRPDQIRVNLDNLRNHPDYEVRQLVEVAPVAPVTSVAPAASAASITPVAPVAPVAPVTLEGPNVMP